MPSCSAARAQRVQTLTPPLKNVTYKNESLVDESSAHYITFMSSIARQELGLDSREINGLAIACKISVEINAGVIT